MLVEIIQAIEAAQLQQTTCSACNYHAPIEDALKEDKPPNKGQTKKIPLSLYTK